MKNIIRTGLLVAAFSSATAFASTIVLETGDTISSAHVVTGFTLASDANIENSTTKYHATVTGHNNAADDVDWFTFTALAGTTVHLDIDTDNHGGLFDTTMALWSSSGSLLSQSDDDAGDPGSETAGYYYYNSQIYFTVAYSGMYAVSVSNYNNFANGVDPFGNYGSGLYATGGAYDLHISMPDATSSVALLGLGAVLLGLMRRKLKLA